MKARETTAVLALGLRVPLTEDERLPEIRMNTGFFPAAEFRGRITPHLDGSPDADSEAREAPVNRIASTFHRPEHRRDVDGFVSHGRFLATLTAARLPLSAPAPGLGLHRASGLGSSTPRSGSPPTVWRWSRTYAQMMRTAPAETATAPSTRCQDGRSRSHSTPTRGARAGASWRSASTAPTGAIR